MIGPRNTLPVHSRIWLLLIFCCIVFQATAQKKERFYNYAWTESTQEAARFYSVSQKTDSGWLRLDYFLPSQTLQMKGLYADEAEKVPNGWFYYLFANRQRSQEGKYVNGLKEGLWLSFHHNGMLRDSTVYVNDKPQGLRLAWYENGTMMDSSFFNSDGSGVKILWFDNGNLSEAGYYGAGRLESGKWKFFHKNGQMSAEEIYEKGVLTQKKYYDTNGKELSKTKNPEQEPSFPGGPEGWRKYVEKNLYFPDQYKISGGEQLTVVINFTIDEAGKVINSYVSVPFDPRFDKIALELIQKSPDWIPATDRHNRHVRAYRRQPVTFSQSRR